MDPFAPAHELIGRRVRIYQDGVFADDGSVAEIYGDINGVTIDVLGGLEPSVRLWFDVDELGEWWLDTTDLITVSDFSDRGPFELPLGKNPVRLTFHGASPEPKPQVRPLSPPVRTRPSALAEVSSAFPPERDARGASASASSGLRP